MMLDVDQRVLDAAVGRRLTANMQSGGSLAKHVEEAEGRAALITPLGPTVVTQAIGRGRTKPASSL